MRYIVVTIIIVAISFLGAVSHENDLARNFKQSGDAKAWFYEIKK